MTKIQETTNYLKTHLPSIPKAVVVLGSGITFEEGFETIKTLSFNDIPHAKTTSIAGHQGQLVYGLLEGKPLLIQQGRRHFYEGFTMREVTHLVACYHQLGIETLVLTNACGGINTAKVDVGSFLVLSDFINGMPSNPLIGETLPGTTRFPDMTEPFDVGLRAHLETVFEAHNEPFVEGTYASFMGPYYETKAEIEAYKRLGADVIGMSTVPEVILAHALGLKVAAISLVTNLATGIQEKNHDHAHVVAIANQRSKTLTNLLKDALKAWL